MEEEIWKDIEGYERGYQVSNLGRVRSFKYKNEKILKFNYDKQGYLLVHLCLNGVRRCKKVHRLVAQAFIENKNNKTYVNHKDGNKQNNNSNNLEWVTPSENNIHAFRTRLSCPPKAMQGRFGKNNPNSKIVLQIDKNVGTVINTFYGTLEAERQTGIKATNIGNVCNNRRYCKTAGGYIWKYKE
ncbi:MAG: hypothetical protein HFJ60_08980 [Clostridia bacterium]|jgi:hypothetical protein|nr:hypothetical protein [Clostridia bacterium]